MRGVVSGQDGNHSASQPSVGTYFDEQPVTTIDGTVDMHIYDIARIEVLEGPQGTLYGASSEAGTIRIITNKPDPSKFEASYDVSGQIDLQRRAGFGSRGLRQYSALAESRAVRIVGWDEHDPGYISNVARYQRQCRHLQRPADVSDLDSVDRRDPERQPQRRLQHVGDPGRPGRLEDGISTTTGR